MITKEFLQYTGFCAPVISSLSCAVMLAIYRHRHGKQDENILYRLLITYFLAISLLWAISLVYVYFPLLYVRINILYYLGLFWGQVVFYQFIYTLTRLPGEKRFFPVHYIIPLVIVGVFAVWSAFVPFDVQVQLVVSRGEPVPGYEAYSRLFTSRLAFRGVWNIVYTALAWWRLLAYRRTIADYSSNADRSSLAWVALLLLISFSLVPPSLLSAVYSKKVLISSILLLLPQLLLVVQHAIVCYNMAVGNFVVIRYPEEEEDYPVLPETTTITEEERAARRRKFEKYMNEHRPYLNPELQISDLALAFGTNRTYLSRFINREYGMNFSRYINLLRFQEMERLRNDLTCAHLAEEERACMAGFGNFRGYMKMKKQIKEEERINEKQRNKPVE
ncbi:MAG: hypothetical protein BHV81_16750 [Butyricimonas synergistica]|nr:MAG: hypothetical protein BHV81_16750 [Butyricimonas synergistica]